MALSATALQGGATLTTDVLVVLGVVVLVPVVSDLASSVSAGLAGRYPELHAFSMFEFTRLGVVVALVGGTYLLFVGH